MTKDYDETTVNRAPENKITEQFLCNEYTKENFDIWHDGPLCGTVNVNGKYYAYMLDIDEQYSLFEISDELLEEYSRIIKTDYSLHEYLDWAKKIDFNSTNDLWCDDIWDWWPE